jgi:hypothetical protein
MSSGSGLPYTITDYTKKRAKELGVIVEPSTRKNKKLDVYKDDELIASIGDSRYSDYPTYLKTKGKAYADERRKLYHLRHTQDTMNEKLSKILLW